MGELTPFNADKIGRILWHVSMAQHFALAANVQMVERHCAEATLHCLEYNAMLEHYLKQAETNAVANGPDHQGVQADPAAKPVTLGNV